MTSTVSACWDVTYNTIKVCVNEPMNISRKETSRMYHLYLVSLISTKFHKNMKICPSVNRNSYFFTKYNFAWPTFRNKIVVYDNEQWQFLTGKCIHTVR